MGGRLGGVFGWVGIAVLAATVPFAAWAWWTLGGEGLSVEDPVNRMWGFSVAILAAFVPLMVCRAFGVGGASDPDVAQGYVRCLGICAGTAAVVVFVALPWNSLPPIAFPLDYVSSEQAIALWGVSVLLALGMVLSLGLWVGPPDRPRGRWWVGTPVGVLVVVLAAALVTPLAEYRPVEHSFLSEAPGEPAPVPADVTRVGWTWEVPEDAGFLAVRAGTHGPVIVLEDGLTGLDGATGKELWTYRAPYSKAASHRRPRVVFGQPGLAFVTFQPSGSDTRDLRQVLIETATGRIVTEVPLTGREGLDSQPGTDHRAVHATRDVYLTWPEEELVAYDLRSNEVLWRRDVALWNEESSCIVLPESVNAHGDQILVGELCADQDPKTSPASLDFMDLFELGKESEGSDTASVTAIDVATGTVNWRREWSAAELEVSPVPSFSRALPGAEPLLLAGGHALDLRTGEDSAATGDGLIDLESLARDEEYFWNAEDGGALLGEPTSPDDHRAPVLLHRMDAEGRIQATTKLRYPESTVGLHRSEALADTLVYADAEPLKHGSATLTVSVIPQDEEVVGWKDARTFEFTADLFEDTRNDEGRPRHELNPAPGSVVMTVTGKDKRQDVVQVFGLVP